MGAERPSVEAQPIPSMPNSGIVQQGSLNDQIIQKANQNAIENYKKYISSVKDIRAQTLD
jgi:hypothetical protein